MPILRRISLPGRRHPALWLALFGLVFQGLLPLSYNAMQRAMVDAARAEAGIGQLVICTALGMRTVTLQDGKAADPAGKTAPQKAEHNCPVCVAAAGLAHMVMPAALLLALPAIITAAVFSPPAYTAPDRQVWLPAQARAPPASPL